MAAANPVLSLQEEATCSICLEYYTDPVTTKCGHNFCRPCASAYSQRVGRAFSCPQCRELCSQGDLGVNRQLQSIVELVKQLSVQQERPPGEGLCAEHEQRPPAEDLCAVHEEKLKLFCEEDKKLICVICRESQEHAGHKVRPIKEVAEEYKAKLQKWLPTLRGELKATKQDKLEEENGIKAMRHKLEAERKKIDDEFQRLQQLLKKQEQTLLSRLEEMDKKIATVENSNMAKLSAEIFSLEALITDIEKKCEQPVEQLLKDIKVTLERCDHVMDQQPGAKVKKYKVSVTLDKDTAHDRLALSERGRRVRFTSRHQGRPRNHKKFTFFPAVLGRDGFTSGRHYWELQFLQEGVWAVGVALKLVSRMEGITLSPEMGAWTVCGSDGQYWACTSPRTPLSTQQRPRKLGLYLDCDSGQLSVYNADTMDTLYTFNGAAFNGQVYPFFCVSGSGDLLLV